MEVMFYPAFVGLSIYLLATSRKNYWSDLHENFTGDVSLDNEELVQFCRPHLDTDLGIF